MPETALKPSGIPGVALRSRREGSQCTSTRPRPERAQRDERAAEPALRKGRAVATTGRDSGRFRDLRARRDPHSRIPPFAHNLSADADERT